jgi:hypothetical protein
MKKTLRSITTTLNNFGYKLLTNTEIDELTNLAVVCAYCQGIFAVSYNEWTKGFSCPHCSKTTPTIHKDLKGSKGEKAVEEWLIANRINYKKEYSVAIEGKNFRYDFLVLDESNQPLGVIEVHGLQHYRPVEFFGGKDAWHVQTSVDLAKKHYALNNFVFYYKISSVHLNNFAAGLENLKFLLPGNQVNTTSLLVSYNHSNHYLLDRLEEPKKHMRGPFKTLSNVNSTRAFKLPKSN